MRRAFSGALLSLAITAALVGCTRPIAPPPPPPPPPPQWSEPITVRRAASDSPAWGSDIVQALASAGFPVNSSAVTYPATMNPPKVAEVWYGVNYDEAQGVCQKVRKKYKGSIIRRITGQSSVPVTTVNLPIGAPPGPDTNAPPPLCAQGPDIP